MTVRLVEARTWLGLLVALWGLPTRCEALVDDEYGLFKFDTTRGQLFLAGIIGFFLVALIVAVYYTCHRWRRYQRSKALKTIRNVRWDYFTPPELKGRADRSADTKTESQASRITSQARTSARGSGAPSAAARSHTSNDTLAERMRAQKSVPEEDRTARDETWDVKTLEERAKAKSKVVDLDAEFDMSNRLRVDGARKPAGGDKDVKAKEMDKPSSGKDSKSPTMAGDKSPGMAPGSPVAKSPQARYDPASPLFDKTRAWRGKRGRVANLKRYSSKKDVTMV